eukprot:TRINITY_DN14928_c0_g1_i1.p1 TRINITY_DN14928_c0_g1~~TRINITY_DN14928_c0_g1_i1.p1  ORF type:complete len:386 (+),score=121.35 TRINITY_DN14928_c0_g1_i1:90-1247(+)
MFSFIPEYFKAREEEAKKMERKKINQWHGFKGKEEWALPQCVAQSDKANRADQNNLIKANEYLDTPEVLNQKMEEIAKLIKKSQNCITYTGAGLSRSSGIPDYATKADNSIVNTPTLSSPIDANPTFSHHCLVSLEKGGYLKQWIQQNHDGLPQKAMFPQEKMNEIHGAWFDPSNPVVQFSGSLRTDLYQSMLEWEKKADLCLCLGTSLSGMNADRVARTPATKALKGEALGTIIINLQQTELDSDCTIRVWAKLDDAFKLLLEKLELEVSLDRHIDHIPEEDLFKIPYNAEGHYDPNCSMLLDLREDAQVKIVAKGAMNDGAIGHVYGKKKDGSYQLQLTEREKKRGGIFTVSRLYGSWFVLSALEGKLSQIPIINVDPQIAFV